jgi:hypothetical protein
MESLLVLRGVREVSALAKPSAPETVSQRAFDHARARSPEHAGLPAARRITEQLGMSWHKALGIAHGPERTAVRVLADQRRTPVRAWLTAEYAAFALKIVARRLDKSTLTRGEYRGEREALLRDNGKRWLHGKQQMLPSDEEIVGVAGTWQAAMDLAGLGPAPQGRTPRLKHVALSRVEVMDRFYEVYGKRPSILALRAFALGNHLPMRAEETRRWSEIVAEWEARREERGLPAPPVVDGRGNPRSKRPDYSLDVGVARAGESPHWGRWRDPGICVDWIARYIAAVGPGERSTQRGYKDWARKRSGAPNAATFEAHGGWTKLRRLAQERACHQPAVAGVGVEV